MTFAVAHIIAPALAAQVADSFGFNVLWQTDLVLCSVGALGFYWLQRKQIKK
jgi:hypothetical protein